MTCFDILNIEYNEEGYLLDFNLPDTMRICVKEGDNWSHTEEAIRKQINNIEELYANDVKVVDFTAFYAGTTDPLRGNYEDYAAEMANWSGRPKTSKPYRGLESKTRKRIKQEAAYSQMMIGSLIGLGAGLWAVSRWKENQEGQ